MIPPINQDPLCLCCYLIVLLHSYVVMTFDYSETTPFEHALSHTPLRLQLKLSMTFIRGNGNGHRGDLTTHIIPIKFPCNFSKRDTHQHGHLFFI